MTDTATKDFSRLNITRLPIGKGGHQTKGLVERHIALTKLGMLHLHSAAQKENLDIGYNGLCWEICMCQNLMLEYHGGTPQQALFGHVGQSVFNVKVHYSDRKTLGISVYPDCSVVAASPKGISKESILEKLMLAY